MALISLEESDEAFDRLKDIVELKLSLLNTELIPIADISSTMRMVRLLRSVQEVFRFPVSDQIFRTERYDCKRDARENEEPWWSRSTSWCQRQT